MIDLVLSARGLEPGSVCWYPSSSYQPESWNAARGNQHTRAIRAHVIVNLTSLKAGQDDGDVRDARIHEDLEPTYDRLGRNRSSYAGSCLREWWSC